MSMRGNDNLVSEFYPSTTWAMEMQSMNWNSIQEIQISFYL